MRNTRKGSSKGIIPDTSELLISGSRESIPSEDSFTMKEVHKIARPNHSKGVTFNSTKSIIQRPQTLSQTMSSAAMHPHILLLLNLLTIPSLSILAQPQLLPHRPPRRHGAPRQRAGPIHLPSQEAFVSLSARIGRGGAAVLVGFDRVQEHAGVEEAIFVRETRKWVSMCFSKKGILPPNVNAMLCRGKSVCKVRI